jgi:hypothetical protein
LLLKDVSSKVLVLRDCKYSVYFRTPLAEGLGVVVLAPDGKLMNRNYKDFEIEPFELGRGLWHASRQTACRH